MEENNTTTHDTSTAQELYLPTRISGLYISPTIRVLPDCIKIATRQPGARKYDIRWSSWWSEEKLARDDTVSIPTVKDVTDKTLNKHGRSGARVPGIFVAIEEVEELLLVVWTLDEGTETLIKIEPVGKEGKQEKDEAEQDGFVIVDKC